MEEFLSHRMQNRQLNQTYPADQYELARIKQKAYVEGVVKGRIHALTAPMNETEQLAQSNLLHGKPITAQRSKYLQLSNFKSVTLIERACDGRQPCARCMNDRAYTHFVSPIFMSSEMHAVRLRCVLGC